ncbi:MAG: Crp/Fnr family transcriptional regulator [Cyclobacteriaceae bacterium]
MRRLKLHASATIQLPPEDLDRLLTSFRIKSLKAGDFLVKEGDVCREVAFVERGLMRVFSNRKGREITYLIVTEGGFSTSLSSFISQSPSEEAVQAQEDSLLYCLSRTELLQLYDAHPVMEKAARIFFEQLSADLMRRMLVMLSETAEERYERLLKEQPHLLQRIPLHQLASFLGLAPQSLSRIRKNLADFRS